MGRIASGFRPCGRELRVSAMSTVPTRLRQIKKFGTFTSMAIRTLRSGTSAGLNASATTEVAEIAGPPICAMPWVSPLRGCCGRRTQRGRRLPPAPAEEQDAPPPTPRMARDRREDAGTGGDVDDLWSSGKRDAFESRFLVGARDRKGLERAHLETGGRAGSTQPEQRSPAAVPSSEASMPGQENVAASAKLSCPRRAFARRPRPGLCR